MPGPVRAGRAGRAAAAVAVAVVFAAVAAGPARADPPVLRLPAVACASGPYAYVLPRYYPSLHKIGRHTVADAPARRAGAAVLTNRRIEYTGMTLEVQLSTARPDEYLLAGLEVWSRRWNIGPLSVGRDPRRSVEDRAMTAWPQDGPVDLVGPADTIRLELRGGRIERARYRCRAGLEP